MSAQQPDLHPCRCGKAPDLTEWVREGIPHMRIACPCGDHSGVLMYTKPHERGLMLGAAVFAWNLNHDAAK